MPARSFQSLDDLIREVESRVAEQPDAQAVLVTLLKLILASEIDPYLVSGALVETIAATIAKKIPPERQGEVATEAVALLQDRLRDYGLV
jgi:hypothetical protein